MRRPEQVLSRDQLLEHAWDIAYETRSNVVDVYVRYLREKIDRPFGRRTLETVRGVGYRLSGRRVDDRRSPLRCGLRALAFALTTAVALVGLGAVRLLPRRGDAPRPGAGVARAQLDALADLPPAAGPRRDRGHDGRLRPGPHPGWPTSSPRRPGRGLAAPRRPAGPAGGRGDPGSGAVGLADEGRGGDRHCCWRGEGDQVLVVGTSREDLDDALRGVRTQLLIGGPLLSCWPRSPATAGRGGTAADRTDESGRRRPSPRQHSGERLPLPAARDEIHRLGVTLNQMLDRLDAGLQRERRFVAEASHELRTPLALLRMELDLALARPRPTEELSQPCESASEEVDRLTSLSEDLLLLAASTRARFAPRGRLRRRSASEDVGGPLHHPGRKRGPQGQRDGRSRCSSAPTAPGSNRR